MLERIIYLITEEYAVNCKEEIAVEILCFYDFFGRFPNYAELLKMGLNREDMIFYA